MKSILEQTVNRLADHKKPLLAIAAFLILALLAAVIPSRQAQAQDGWHGNSLTLAGSWRIEVTDPSGNFGTYETFTEAGGLVEVNQPGGPFTSIGAWERVGPRKFVAAFYKPIYKPSPQGPQPFELDFTVKVRRLITLSRDGNHLTGVGKLEMFDPAGSLIFSTPPGPFEGTRIVAEPPDL